MQNKTRCKIISGARQDKVQDKTQDKTRYKTQDKTQDKTKQHKTRRSRSNLCFCLSDLSFGFDLGLDLSTVLAFLKLGRLLGLGLELGLGLVLGLSLLLGF